MEEHDDMGFHPIWVNPFYGQLTNGNFLSRPEEERLLFISHLKATLAKIDKPILQQMLASRNWRPKLTAGWFIGFLKDAEFTQAIGETLLREPIYAGMYCFALARIANAQAIHYLEEYLKQNLTIENALNTNDAERLTVQYGMVALQELAPKAAEALDPQWTMFVDANLAFWRRYKERTQESTGDWDIITALTKHWDLELNRQRFRQWLAFAETHFD